MMCARFGKYHKVFCNKLNIIMVKNMIIHSPFGHNAESIGMQNILDDWHRLDYWTAYRVCNNFVIKQLPIVFVQIR